MAGILGGIAAGLGAMKPKVPKKPNPMEGGGSFKFGMQGNGQQLAAGTPVPYTNPYGGGGLAGALQGAFDDTTNEFQTAINQPISPSNEQFGAFGAYLQNLAMNPQGFGDDLIRKQMTRLAERNAGVTANQQRTVRDAGGRNFSSFADVLANISGEGAKRLNEAELDFLLQDAGLKSASRGQGISGGLSLAQIAAQLASQEAGFAAERERPLTDKGAGKTGPGGQFDLLNDQGEIRPFREDGTPLSAFEMERARQQRIAWMQQQTGG